MNEKLTLVKKPREKVPFVTRGSTVSDELKARTLKAMAQRERENAEKAERKKAAHKNTLLRAAVIAALITLIIVVTPMRGYVVSAAEKIWEYIEIIFDHPEVQLQSIEIKKPNYDNVMRDYYDKNHEIEAKITVLGDFKQSIKVDYLTYEFSELYLVNGYIYLSMNISRDKSTDTMPSFGGNIKMAALKNDDVVFITGFDMSDYYMQVQNHSGYPQANKHLINGQYIDQNGNYILAYHESDVKPTDYKKVSINLQTEDKFFYYNFDKFGNKNLRTSDDFEKNWTSNRDAIAAVTEKIKPDKYVIISVDAYFSYMKPLYPIEVTEVRDYQYSYYCDNYKKYEKLMEKANE